MDSSSSNSNFRNRTIVTRATITTAENGGVTIAIEGSENPTSGGERSNAVSIVLDGTSSAMLNSILWATEPAAAAVETVNADQLHAESGGININNLEAPFTPNDSQNNAPAAEPMPASSGIIIAIKLPSDKSPESLPEDDEDDSQLPPLITVAAPPEPPQSSQTNKNASSSGEKENSCEKRKRKLREPFQLDIEASSGGNRNGKKQEKKNCSDDDVDTGNQEGGAKMPDNVGVGAHASTSAAAAGSNNKGHRFYCTKIEGGKLCDKHFAQKAKLTSHINTIHEKITFECEVCGKNCGKQYYLNEHKRLVHSDERPFACYRCKREFKKQSHCKEHEEKCGREEFKSRAPRRPTLKKKEIK